MSLLPRVFATVVWSSVIAVAMACGSSDGSDLGPDGNASGGASSSGASGSSSGSFGSSGNTGDAGSDAGDCFAPVDMYIMFDKSGSMGAPAGDGPEGDCNVGENVDSKWCRAINALSGYLKSPAAKDQAAAVQFFSGLDTVDCDTGAPYTTPAAPATSYTTLPSNAFDSVLNGVVPGENTPMEAALRGLTTFTAANRRPGHVTIGIFITDGDPQGCNTDLDDLSDLLQAHYDATKIRTYVIGMNGATFENLEQLAQGGNAPPHPATVGTLTGACGDVAAPCHFWNVGDGDPQGFIAALAAIQESADGCKPGGGSVNPK